MLDRKKEEEDDPFQPLSPSIVGEGMHTNWPTVQAVQTELIPVGRLEVVSLFNKFLVEFDKMSDEDSSALIKDLWSEIRKNLFQEPTLNLVFFG